MFSVCAIIKMTSKSVDLLLIIIIILSFRKPKAIRNLGGRRKTPTCPQRLSKLKLAMAGWDPGSSAGMTIIKNGTKQRTRPIWTSVQGG